MEKRVYISLIALNTIFFIFLSLQNFNILNKINYKQEKLNTLFNSEDHVKGKRSYTKDVECFMKDNRIYIKSLETIPNKNMVNMEIIIKGKTNDIKELLNQIQCKQNFRNIDKINMHTNNEGTIDADVSLEFVENKQLE